MSKETKYEAAFAELQTIVRKMENDELDIDQMAEELKRAQELMMNSTSTRWRRS